MKRILFIALTLMLAAIPVSAQSTKFYDETIDPIEQIDAAVAKAQADGKYVICQVGGNWCKWCRWFGKFITEDQEINQVIQDNFVYIHVNYTDGKDPRTQEAMKRLKNPARFGFPVLVILDTDGNVIHTQQSDYLEEGEGYNHKRVLDFFNHWTPTAVTTLKIR